MGGHSSIPAGIRMALLVALLVALALGSVSRAGAEAGIRVQVDRTELTVDDRLRMTVMVTGSQSAQPTLPPLSDFAVFAQGQETRLSLINGRASSSVSFNYVLEPQTTGTFTIGAATVEIDGTTYSSRPLEVRVVEAAAAPDRARDLFVTVKVSNDKPYVGEQMIYTWRLYRRVRIADARLEPQSFDGFLVEDLGDVREYETTVRGQSYLVSEFRKALFPQEEGLLMVPVSRLSCQVVLRSDRDGASPLDSFFGRLQTETQVLRTRPIEVEVRPLPTPPAGFSGLVGKFELRTKVSRAELETGQSTTVEMTVEGTGNVQMIGEPRLPELAAFKVYDDRSTTSIERGASGLGGSRTFHKAFVPLEPGELVVPSLSLTYFDPETASYQISRSPPIALRVTAADGPEDLRLTETLAPSAGKVNVRILADDVLPLHRGVDSLTAASGRLPSSLTLLGGLLAPPLFYLGALLFDRRRRKLASDAGLRRRREALRRARRAVRVVERQAAAGEAEAAVESASLCLRRYIGDKLGLEGSALTPAEARHHLQRRGANGALVEETGRLLESLEAARFGAAGSAAERLPEELRSLLGRLQKDLAA